MPRFLKIHQVLATLGYGDAIGHEVLGIQRALRQAGFESEIFVQTADHAARGSDARLSATSSRPAIRRTSSSIISPSARAPRASRTPCRIAMILVYHNITPPEFFLDVHEQLAEQCFKGRRELGIYRGARRSGARRFGVQPAGARGARLQSHRRPAGGARLLASRSRAERSDCGRVRRRMDEHPVRRPDHPEQAHRGRHPLFPRVSAHVQSALAAALRRVVPRLREISRDAAGARRVAGHVERAFYRARHRRGADRLLRGGGSVPVRERARRLLRPDRGSVLQAGAGRGVRGHAPCPSTMDGAGVLYTTQEPLEVAALVDAVLRRRPLRRHRRQAGRGARPAAGEGLRQHAARLRRSGAEEPEEACAARWRGISGISSSSAKSCTSFSSTGRRSIAGCPTIAGPTAGIVAREEESDEGEPVGAGRAQRRRHRRQRPARARSAARDGARLRALRADDRRRSAPRGPAVRRTRREARRRHDLSFRASVADVGGVRVAAHTAACCSITT